MLNNACHRTLNIFLIMQTLDLSFNSLSGTVPMYMLVKNTTSGAPFQRLREVRIFVQWGSRLCAHLAAQSHSWLHELDDFPGEFDGFPDFRGQCINGKADLNHSEVAKHAAAHAHVGPGTLLMPPPVFKWPAAADGAPCEMFIGVCDLPEMVSFKYAFMMLPQGTPIPTA